jgi:uncharacterized protein with GYD domain
MPCKSACKWGVDALADLRHRHTSGLRNDNSGQRKGPPLATLPNCGPATQRRTIMATYIALSNFTDQGIRNVKDSTKRADAVKDAAGKFGARLTQIYWTLGKHDLVAVIEAPDDASATAFALAIGTAGNVRTQTLRAFSKDEMSAILAKLD